MQRIALAVLVALAISMLIYTLGCLFGIWPWMTLPLTFGNTVYPQAGKHLQTGATVLLLGLCFFLPGNARIMALENSHRRFHIGMSDVARAYAAAHRFDREGVFSLKGEFDSIRERIAFLRDHPDLSELEPSVLEIAAQMSHVSAELAQTYSDGNIARARDFLIARQQEVETFNERIEGAKAVAGEMRQWLAQLEMEESIARAQLDRLREDLYELLPQIRPDDTPPSEDAAEPDADTAEERDAQASNVTQLPRAAE